MPLPASLFTNRGRSSSVMASLTNDNTHQQGTTDSMGIWTGAAMQLALDDTGAPMYTPPVTAAGFDQQAGGGLFLGDAFSDAFAGASKLCGLDGQHQQHHQHLADAYQDTTGPSTSYYPFNPRAHLLRRTSSTSTLGSTGDEDEIEWSQSDIDRLKAIYDACVEEASFETPFSGPPPSQLLHAIAKACRRAYPDEWRHSITQTRTKALQIAKDIERRERAKARADDSEDERARLGIAQGGRGSWREAYGASMLPGISEATPKQGGADDTDATPRRQRLRRNDSMDFLPHTRNMDALARLSSKLNQSSEDGPIMFYNPHHGCAGRSRTETTSAGSSPPHSAPLHGRLARSMTFTGLSLAACDEDAQIPMQDLRLNSMSPSPVKASFDIRGPDDTCDKLYAAAPLSARPATKLGYGFGHAQQQGLMHSLYHAPSSGSLQSSTSSSLSSAPSLTDSNDEDGDASAAGNLSVYGSSLASDASSSAMTTLSNNSIGSGGSTPGSKKRTFDVANDEDASDYLRDGLGTSARNAFGSWSAASLASFSSSATGSIADDSSEPATPCGHLELGDTPTGQQEHDYFSAPFTSLGGPAVLPTDLSINTQLDEYPRLSSHFKMTKTQKPPLHKSHTFDAISTSPRKCMRLEQEGWLIAPPRLPTAGTGISLDSPFDEHFLNHKA